MRTHNWVIVCIGMLIMGYSNGAIYGINSCSKIWNKPVDVKRIYRSGYIAGVSDEMTIDERFVATMQFPQLMKHMEILTGACAGLASQVKTQNDYIASVTGK